jgi:hypothetical protein
MLWQYLADNCTHHICAFKCRIEMQMTSSQQKKEMQMTKLRATPTDSLFSLVKFKF